MSEFQYFYTLQPNSSFELEDIGNFAISCTNDVYHEYILFVRTEYGITKMLTYGPIQIDRDDPADNVDCKYQKFDFSSYKIERAIDKFVNDSKRVITQVTQISQEEALMKMKDVTLFV